MSRNCTKTTPRKVEPGHAQGGCGRDRPPAQDFAPNSSLGSCFLGVSVPPQQRSCAVLALGSPSTKIGGDSSPYLLGISFASLGPQAPFATPSRAPFPRKLRLSLLGSPGRTEHAQGSGCTVTTKPTQSKAGAAQILCLGPPYLGSPRSPLGVAWLHSGVPFLGPAGRAAQGWTADILRGREAEAPVGGKGADMSPPARRHPDAALGAKL